MIDLSNNNTSENSGREKYFVITQKWKGHLDQSIVGLDAGAYTPLLVIAGKYGKTSPADMGFVNLDAPIGYFSLGSKNRWSTDKKPNVTISNVNPLRISYEAEFSMFTRRAQHAKISGSLEFVSENPFVEPSTSVKEYILQQSRNNSNTNLIVDDPFGSSREPSTVTIENNSLEGIMLVFN